MPEKNQYWPSRDILVHWWSGLLYTAVSILTNNDPVQPWLLGLVVIFLGKTVVGAVHIGQAESLFTGLSGQAFCIQLG